MRLAEGVSIGDVSRVEFRLEPTGGGGTRLTVTESPGVVVTNALARTADRFEADVPRVPRWRAFA